MTFGNKTLPNGYWIIDNVRSIIKCIFSILFNDNNIVVTVPIHHIDVIAHRISCDRITCQPKRDQIFYGNIKSKLKKRMYYYSYESCEAGISV